MTDDPLARLRRAVEEIRLATAEREPTGLAHDEADEVIGSVATDDARGFDPFRLLRAFSTYDTPVVVMGQVAGILHGSVELTGDLDLLWDGQPEHAPRMAEAFASVGATLTDADGSAVALDADAFALPKVLFRSSSASGDCCTPKLPWGDLDIDGILRRADVTSLDGLEVRYVKARDLIAMRSAVGRAKDLRRNEELRALHRLRD